METRTTFVIRTFPVPLGLRLQQNKTEIICIKDAERWPTNATHCLWSASSSSPKSLSWNQILLPDSCSSSLSVRPAFLHRFWAQLSVHSEHFSFLWQREKTGWLNGYFSLWNSSLSPWHNSVPTPSPAALQTQHDLITSARRSHAAC